MKLSGKHDTYDVIRVVRFPAVHVRTLRVSLTNVDELAVRILRFRCSPPSFFTKMKPKVSSLYIIR